MSINKPLLLLLLTTCFGMAQEQGEFIDRQGSIALFSYTSVENIKAENNQVASIVDLSNNQIAVRMLMRAFVFEKALMEEHFNESYIESDLYPQAIFQGTIIGLDLSITEPQTRKIQGVFTLRGIEKELDFKATISKEKNRFTISGKLELTVADFNIKIPPLLAPNIADTITINFSFEYEPYEN